MAGQRRPVDVMLAGEAADWASALQAARLSGRQLSAATLARNLTEPSAPSGPDKPARSAAAAAAAAVEQFTLFARLAN